MIGMFGGVDGELGLGVVEGSSGGVNGSGDGCGTLVGSELMATSTLELVDRTPEGTMSRRIEHGRGRLVRVFVATTAIVGAAAGCSSDDDSGSTSSTAAGAPSSVNAVAPADDTTPGAVTTTAGTPPSDPTATTTTATTVAATTTTTIPPTTTTTIPLVTEGALVLVANAAGIPGAAGQLTGALQAVGYAMEEPTDAAGYEESLDTSKIYFRPEAEAAAQSLGAVMQIASVTRMPTPAPIVDAMVGLGDATVLIMLGKDLAAQPIPGLAGR